MKKIISIIMAVLLIASLAACGNSPKAETKEAQAAAADQKLEQAAAAEQEEAQESADTKGPEGAPADEGTDQELPSETAPDGVEASTDGSSAHSDVLVAYFSATGTTKGVAEKIAAITGGDLYEIVPAEPYTDADLNWSDRNSRSTKEQNDKSVRPEIGSTDISLEGYATVYLGFPIWWGEEPRILDTFVESYSFDGITVIPFCTSSSSGIGRSGPNMEELAGSGTWLQGKRFGGNASEADIESWIGGLK